MSCAAPVSQSCAECRQVPISHAGMFRTAGVSAGSLEVAARTNVPLESIVIESTTDVLELYE
jgi:hypothetical protein